MEYNFEKPIVFFDTETTGVDVKKDRIIELGMRKYTSLTDYQVKTIVVNPEIKIPAEASEVHGFFNKDVENKPVFRQYAKAIKDFITGSALAGFNSNKFDIPLFFNEMERAGVPLNESDFEFIDVGNIFKIMNSRDLTAAYKEYCGLDLENAHTADADVQATAEVFFAQLERHKEELPTNLQELAIFSNFGALIIDASGFLVMKENQICFGYGKHKGDAIIEVIEKDPSYIDWVLYKADFSKKIKDIIKDQQPKEKQKLN